MKRNLQNVMIGVLTGLVIVGIQTSASAQAPGNVQRLSAEFQFDPTLGAVEVATAATPGAGGTGGTTVYSKTLFSPFRTLYVTFSGTGDTHALTPSGTDGAALLMTCVVDGAVCQSGGGLSTAGPSGWITLQKMPQPSSFTNCNLGGVLAGDGGGGSGDCHDNNLNYTWCTTVPVNGVHTVELKLASSNGGVVFYERAHILIDATPNSVSPSACVPAALGPFVGTLP